MSWKRRGCPPLPRPQRLHQEGPRKAGPERGLGEQGVLPEGGSEGESQGSSGEASPGRAACAGRRVGPREEP